MKRILRTTSKLIVYMLYASSGSSPSSTVLRDRFVFSVALYALGLLVRVVKLYYTCYIYVNVLYCNRTSVELLEERSPFVYTYLVCTQSEAVGVIIISSS